MTCQIHVIPSHDPLYDFLHISNEWGYYVFLRFVCFRCLQEVASTRIENLQHMYISAVSNTTRGVNLLSDKTHIRRSKPLIKQNQEQQTSYQTKPGGANLLSNKNRGETSYQTLSFKHHHYQPLIHNTSLTRGVNLLSDKTHTRRSKPPIKQNQGEKTS